MTLPGPRFTYEDYKLLPEEKRCEIIEGDLLMTPAPSFRHQAILKRLLVCLSAFIDAHSLGEIVPAPTDVILSAENVVQPDLLFVAQERMSIVDQRGGIYGAPDLTVEILSPATSRRDLILKRKLYAKFGVQEYWIVDPEAKTIEVLTQTVNGLDTWKVFAEEGTLTSPLLVGFSLPAGTIFVS